MIQFGLIVLKFQVDIGYARFFCLLYFKGCLKRAKIQSHN